VTHEYPPHDFYDSVTRAHVNALSHLGFTERQREFLVTVMAGRDDVYVQSFPDAAIRRMVSSGGGAYPRWGLGGQELLYRAAEGRLMTIPVRLVGSSVELGTPSVVMRLADAPAVHPYPYDVAADGRILALSPASGGVRDLTLTVLMNWQAALEP
jgi:hypothetical protein